MGGISNFEKNVYNARLAGWVRDFIAQRCIVRPNRWEYAGELYAAYKEYAKNKTDMGWSCYMPHNRFSRCVSAVFTEGKWFYERMATPDGRHRIIAGLCLKENSMKRAPEDLYASMENKLTKKLGRPTLAAQLAKRQNADNAQRAVEAQAVKAQAVESVIKSAVVPQKTNQDSAERSSETSQKTDRDALAKQLWDKG